MKEWSKRGKRKCTTRVRPSLPVSTLHTMCSTSHFIYHTLLTIYWLSDESILSENKLVAASLLLIILFKMMESNTVQIHYTYFFFKKFNFYQFGTDSKISVCKLKRVKFIARSCLLLCLYKEQWFIKILFF